MHAEALDYFKQLIFLYKYKKSIASKAENSPHIHSGRSNDHNRVYFPIS